MQIASLNYEGNSDKEKKIRPDKSITSFPNALDDNQRSLLIRDRQFGK